MGNETSVHIHLDKMDDSVFKPKHYQLRSHSERYSKCKYFRKVTYDITYYLEYPRIQRSTEFYIYFTKRTWTVVNFTYYPYYESDVIERVYCFYSILRLDEPLVLGFTTRGKITKYYRYMDLDFKTSTGLPPNGFDEDSVLYNLRRENEKLNRKLTLYVGTGTSHHINGIPGDEGPKETYSGKFKWVFRKANTDSDFKGNRNGPWVLYTSNLFTINSRKNKIDDSLIRLFNNKTFYAIYVYYTYDDSIAVLVELVKDFNDTIFIARKDKDGNCWERVYINKTAGHEFENELLNIQRNMTDSHRGRCKPIEYREPAPVDLEKCDADKKTVPRPIPKGYPKTLPEESAVDLSTHSETPPDSPEYPRPTHPPRKPEDHPPHLEIPPFRPPGHREVWEKSSVVIDISKTSKTTYGRDRNIDVSDKTVFTECDLFCYFTHSVRGEFEYSISLTYTGSSQLSFNEIDNLSRVKFVSVYFNNYDLKNPLVLKIHHSDGKINYYSNFIKGISSHLSSVIEVAENKLVDELIGESDRINNRNTFQLDRTTTYNGINVTSKSDSGRSYIFHTHSNSGNPNKKVSDIIYNKKSLIVESSGQSSKIDIQNKKYDYVKAYVLEIKKSLLLLIELKESNTVSFLYRRDFARTFKKLDGFSSGKELDVKNKLNEIHYFLSKSIIIDIDKRVVSEISNSYEMKLIDNRTKKDSFVPEISKYSMSTKTNPLKHIRVINQTVTCKTHANHSFILYSHVVVESGGASEINDISGLRLYLPKISGTDRNMGEIELYKNNSTDAKNRMFLYYTPNLSYEEKKNKVLVYFSVHDPRPLLICHNDQFFRQVNANNHLKWYHDPTIKSSDNCKLLNTLNDINNKMKKKMIFVKEGSMSNIKVERDTSLGEFRKDIYTADLSKSGEYFYTLPKHFLFHKQSTHGSNIDELLDKLDRSVFDTVNVYMNQTGESLKDMILIEFINESQKKHLKRMDELGNFWIEEIVSYDGADQLQNKLQMLHSGVSDTIVYEIDRTNINYSSRVLLTPSQDDPTRGFDKYIHMPSTSAGHPKKTLILYNGTKLVTKHGDRLVVLEEIVYQNFNKVTVYFTTDGFDDRDRFPLLIELNKGDYRNETNIYYAHIRKNDDYYWDSISLSYSISDEKPLIKTLNEIKFNLLDSIFVLINERKKAYGGPEIKEAIKEVNVKQEFNLSHLRIDNISVNKFTTSCLSKRGFYAYKHTIGSFGEESKFGLRFFIHSGVSDNKYVELNLFDYNGSLKEYVYYNSYDDSVYFYFYGNDPRPLLLCYGEKAFGATTVDNYHKHIWFRDDNIRERSCHNISENDSLISRLSLIVGFLNPVNIERRLESTLIKEPNQIGIDNKIYHAYSTYEDAVRINVTYENKSCYRVYIYESNGFKGSGRGFRLGNVTYGSNGLDSGINYNLAKQLTRVSVYYNLFDINHNHPLLVSLRFFDNSYEYYELGDKALKFWTLIDDNVDESKVESKAYEILKKLEINFERKKEDPTLFDRDDCSEGASKAAVIGGSVGGVVSTAAVGGGVTVAVRPELILTSIRALI